MEKEVVITYETLFEILRREKTREELQKLPDNFHNDVGKYLSDKKQTMLSIANDQFSEIEQEKAQSSVVVCPFKLGFAGLRPGEEARVTSGEKRSCSVLPWRMR